MKNIPLITVLITAYNVEKYIGRCLRSILDQSFPRNDYEVVVIEDKSTDRTKFALELFENDINLICNKKRLRLPKSLNNGILIARGKYLVRLDGDDYVNREFLKMLYLHLEMNNNIDAIACDYLMVDNNENIISRKNCLDDPIACGIMFRVDQLIDLGMYDEKFKLREEEDLRIRFLKKHSLARVNLPLYRYRMHGENMTNNFELMSKYQRLLVSKHKKI